MVDTRTGRFELSGFKGQLFHPGDAEYDEARGVFNGLIDRKPALIARCANADDVATAIGVARDQSLPRGAAELSVDRRATRAIES